jgi:transposase
MLLFIKTTKAGKYEYIKLVESYREGKNTKHRVLYNFGRADLLKKDNSFLRIVRKLCGIAEIPVGEDGNTGDEPPFNDCGEAELHNYGYLAYLRLWKQLGIEMVLEECQHGTKIQSPIPETVFLMAVQHLLEPRSKLSTYQRQNRYFNMGEIKLQHMYRALDKLNIWKEDIESGLFQYNYTRVGREVDVVFYDVTTVAFESVVADELKNFGFSKDCKFNEVQVVMGMIIESDGMPVGYQLFPGNTFDGKTMVGALGNIKKRFGIKRVIIVADRGVNSKNNLNLIKGAGYGYIMSSKIRGTGISKAMQAKIFDPAGFDIVSDGSGNEDFRYKTIPYTNTFKDESRARHDLEENLIVSYSPKRAKKDRKDRGRLVEKAKKLLENPEKIKASNRRGGKKYINQTGTGKTEWQLAEDAIEEDARFDGYLGIQTSEKNMTATDVIEAYHALWKIEESFRIMKSTLEVKPVFHWTPNRIHGHFVVCFLAFLMERKMELVLKDEKDDLAASPQKIQEALNTMLLAAVKAGGEEHYIKAKLDPLSKKIFRTLNIGIPLNINNKSDLISCFQLDEELEHVQLAFS